MQLQSNRVDIMEFPMFDSTFENRSDFLNGSENNTDNENQNNGMVDDRIKEILYLDILKYTLYILGVIITLATIIGNILIIVAVIGQKRLRKIGNMLIINLAVSDFLVGVVVSPLALAYDITDTWMLGEVACDMWVSMDIICCTASIINLCAIAYDRCNAIVQPMTYARKRTIKRVVGVVVFVWVYSLLIALPRLLGWRKESETGLPNGKCFISQDIGYTLFSTLLAFFIPMCLMLCLYYKIYIATCVRNSQWHLRKGHNHFKGTVITQNGGQCFTKCCVCNWLANYNLDSAEYPSTHEQATQTVTEAVREQSPHCEHHLVSTDNSRRESMEPEDSRRESIEPEDSRRESIEPELLAIYQMRQRSNRLISNATISSVGSFLHSSSDSSQTATTSFSDSSDRSGSLLSNDLSLNMSTDRSISLSSESGVRRYSYNLKGHRLSSGRHSSLQQEVIHEIATAAQMEQESKGHALLHAIGNVSSVDMEDTHDETSDDEKCAKPSRSRRKLKSSTVRRHNSRKSRKIAISHEKRAAKTLGIVMGCFIVCWFPFFLITLLRVLFPVVAIPPLLFKVFVWLGYFNSACNPVIYTFFNKDFRMAFKKMSCRTDTIVYV